ncbi:uncharacterized protein L969DRAFT_92770 [Mixia osmundae IAM 14324]|uniref:Uncharacterized protein n=1 Tax=Mixia osmundae (strain CBS 9802 / IAM 14324 / JCM 22182 / KY 12970) TaxID=764103 RepID=G7DYI1_MIXOS|nr:uncharacterized protein L969DRAFT_92770 [Mixia osmundae IAM 14324]KEI41542.1 hypothetical protein L969DRAFT_92770 [Mixia osmundae IAM 14324]GAA95641.1 hypothetical protein E5Q_02297 [Mixia osmundae IAM 14324]
MIRTFAVAAVLAALALSWSASGSPAVSLSKRFGLEPELNCWLETKLVSKDPAVPKTAYYNMIFHRDAATQHYTSMDLVGFQVGNPAPFQSVTQQNVKSGQVLTTFVANATKADMPVQYSYWFVSVGLFYTPGKNDLSYRLFNGIAWSQSRDGNGIPWADSNPYGMTCDNGVVVPIHQF